MSNEYEKHTPHTDALDTLGTIIGEGEKRDAIHIGVEPVVAGCSLSPGAHVKLEDGIASYAYGVDDGVGIVDPFLREPVIEGQRFWLLVYPREISSLRHVWEHPKFPASGETEQIDPDVNKANAKATLESFLDSSDISCLNVDEFVEAAVTGSVGTGEYGDSVIVNESYMHFNGNDAHGSIPDHIWDAVEVYSGQKPVHRPTYFSCSC